MSNWPDPIKFQLIRTSAPALTAVTMAQARMQLRVDTLGSPPSSPEDALISANIAMATQELDAGTGWLGRAVCPQSWTLLLNKFPFDKTPLHLPFPPFIRVESFVYVPASAPSTTVVMAEGTDFRTLPDGTMGDGAMLAPMYTERWPTDVVRDFGAVRIQFRCGYLANASPEAAGVPEIIQNYILSRITDNYDSRGVQNYRDVSDLSSGVQNALNSLRVWGYQP